jgi:hypothetical protein
LRFINIFITSPTMHSLLNIHSLQAIAIFILGQHVPNNLVIHYSYYLTSPSSSPTIPFPSYLDIFIILIPFYCLSLSHRYLRCHPEPQLFTLEQRQILLKYFDECGMTSTHRRNTDIIQRCASEVGTTVERVKNWIGSEAVKRKKKAGILPRPKIELIGTASSPQTRLVTIPPAKKIKRVNGYNLFFSHTVRSGPEISTDFRERNATVARKWAELTEDKRKEWAAKAEAVCTSSMQACNDVNGEGSREGGGERDVVHTLLGGAAGVRTGLGGVVNPELAGGTEEALIEKTLLSIQEKFDLLEQMGFEGYAVLVNTTELQSHFLATSKGRTFHKLRQSQAKPLENPFIGHVFTEEPEASGSGLMAALSHSGSQKRLNTTLSGLNSVETMQKSVLNAFALKFSTLLPSTLGNRQPC